jgi:hypothetical protein
MSRAWTWRLSSSAALHVLDDGTIARMGSAAPFSYRE